MGQRMKSKRFEDSISSRFLINVIDVVLLCVGFFLAHYAFLHSGQNRGSLLCAGGRIPAARRTAPRDGY